MVAFPTWELYRAWSMALRHAQLARVQALRDLACRVLSVRKARPEQAALKCGPGQAAGQAVWDQRLQTVLQTGQLQEQFWAEQEENPEAKIGLAVRQLLLVEEGSQVEYPPGLAREAGWLKRQL